MEKFLQQNVLPSALKNAMETYNCVNLPDWARASIGELVERELVDEINNRFFLTLKFGTGGMRSRTIGNVLTAAELGSSTTNRPDFASVGTAYLNDFNIIGATIALFNHCSKFLVANRRNHELPSVVIAYDVRHFSKHFGELAASTWKQLGGHAMLYPSPRSTPQLSFSVRHLHCTAGIMITASHNPWHDNGLKAYFSDGAQMVDPHASAVIGEFELLPMDKICAFCSKNLNEVTILGEEIDCDYHKLLCETVLRKDVIANNAPHIVFSPLHGTGSVAALPLFRSLNIRHSVVGEQDDQDPNFSTVKSPNPENMDALNMAIALAKRIDAEVVLATDPDGDRLAVAARSSCGEFEIFSGNVIGAMLAEYRILQMKLLRQIPAKGSSHAAIIKTFVTTPLIDKIAAANGVKCVNTLTGFKWIGEKMLDYEQEMLLKEHALTGFAINYGETQPSVRRSMLLKHSTLFLFGCEESYGCLSCDDVRDKDANAACVMVCELAAYANSFGKTLADLRDDMYVKYGYFGESVASIYHDGADGSLRIEKILDDYQNNPPKSIGGSAVTEIVDFSRQTIIDADGKVIPPQKFFLLTLNNGIKFAVRASGTEPKIKFYLFAEAPVPDRSHLPTVIKETGALLERTKSLIIAAAA
jgi:phosphoglucomutase